MRRFRAPKMTKMPKMKVFKAPKIRALKMPKALKSHVFKMPKMPHVRSSSRKRWGINTGRIAGMIGWR